MVFDNNPQKNMLLPKRIHPILVSILGLWIWWGSPYLRIWSFYFVNRSSSETPQGWIPGPFYAQMGLTILFFLVLLYLLRARKTNPLSILPALVISVVLLRVNTRFIPLYEREFYPLQFQVYSTFAVSLCTAGLLYGMAQCLAKRKWQLPDWRMTIAYCVMVLFAYIIDQVRPVFSSMQALSNPKAAVIAQMFLVRMIFPITIGALVFLPFGLSASRNKKISIIVFASIIVSMIYLFVPGLQSVMITDGDAFVDRVLLFTRRELMSNVGTEIWMVMTGILATAAILSLNSPRGLFCSTRDDNV